MQLHAVLTRRLAPLAWVGERLQARWREWLHRRLPSTDTLLLTQRNIYIVPTRAGFLFAATLLLLLVGSINYQLNLGYLLTFLLAGSGVVSMHLTHATLRGLTLHLHPMAAVHAGDAALLEVVLTSRGAARWGVGVRVEPVRPRALTWTDVPQGGQAVVRVSFVPPRRGRQGVPPLVVETRFPLGLFRAWAVWRPASQVLVYPQAERPPAPLPAASPVAGGAAQLRRTDGADIEGIRAYRRGDPPKLVVWKKAARALETGSELVSRDGSTAAHWQLWLDWPAGGGLSDELRLSRLTAWVLEAHRAGADYGLRLPGVEIARGHGEGQRRDCLEALALWR